MMASNLIESPTLSVYRGLQDAYNHFNRELFDGALPDCLITLTHHRGAFGYFRSKPFSPREGDGMDDEMNVDEISLNIFMFRGRTDREIMSTLVHEQVHLWQHHFGKAPKRPTHTKEWAEKMKEIGLYPSDTGAPGGKETGRRVSHFIIEEGKYAEAYETCDVHIDWAGMLPERKKKDRAPKSTYKCESCEGKVRGTADMEIRCVGCDQLMEEK